MRACTYCHLLLSDGDSVCPRDGAPPSEVQLARVPGQLHARFPAIEPFACGATGSSFLAVQAQSGFRGLLKILAPDVAASAAERARLKRELRKQTTLTNNALARIIDGGEIGSDLWLFRDFVQGESLAIRLRQGPLPVPEALAVAGQVASALDEVHRQGLLHRDIKPGHVLLTARVDAVPVVTVIDAGVAARLPSDGVFELLGTPAYVAPEVITGKPASFRSDLYALGCVLYEMLTGKPPFVAATVAEVLAAHGSTEAKEPDVELPAPVRSLLASLLAKEPRRRPFSAQQVRRTLDPYLPAGTPEPSSGTRTLSGNVNAPSATRGSDPGRVTPDPKLAPGSQARGSQARGSQPGAPPAVPPAVAGAAQGAVASVASAQPRQRQSTPIAAMRGAPPPVPAAFPSTEESTQEIDLEEVEGQALAANASEEIEIEHEETLPHVPHATELATAGRTRAEQPALESADAATVVVAKPGLDIDPEARSLGNLGNDDATKVMANPLAQAVAPVAAAPLLPTLPQSDDSPTMIVPTPHAQLEAMPVVDGGNARPASAVARAASDAHADAAEPAATGSARKAVDFDVESLFDDDIDSARQPIVTPPSAPALPPTAAGSSVRSSIPPVATRSSVPPPAFGAASRPAAAGAAAPEMPVPDPEGTVVVARKPASEPKRRPWPLIGAAVVLLLIAGMFSLRSRKPAPPVGGPALPPSAADTRADARTANPSTGATPSAADVQDPGHAGQPAAGTAAAAQPGTNPATAANPAEAPSAAAAAAQAPTEAPPAASAEADAKAAGDKAAGDKAAGDKAADDDSHGSRHHGSPVKYKPPPVVEPGVDYKAKARELFQAGKYKEAASMYEHATAQSPSDSGAFAGLGASCLQSNQPDKAILAYQRAVQLKPNASGFHAALARAYMQKGDRGRAAAAYKKALELDPNNQSALTALAAMGAK